MKIETKYNVGDYVKTKDGEVTRIISIRTTVTEKLVIIKYYDVNNNYETENSILYKVNITEVTE